MTLLLLEGGQISLEVMKIIPRSVLITNETSLETKAKALFCEDRVMSGGWQRGLLRQYVATAVLVGYDDDNQNLRIAKTLARLEDVKVLAFCHDPERFSEFKEAGISNVYCPDLIGAKMVASALFPRVRDLIEIPVFGDSPLMGKRVDDIQYGVDAFIVGLLEGEEIVKPEGRLLEKGDHLLILSLGGKPEELQKIIVRKEARLRTFERIHVFVREEADLVGPLAESIYLAGVVRAEVSVTCSDEAFSEKANNMLKASGLRFQMGVRDLSDPTAWSGIQKEEAPEADLLVISAGLDLKEKRHFIKWKLRQFIDELEIPLLVSKKRHPYFSLLTMIDDSEGSKDMVENSFKLSFLSRSSLTVLRYLEALPGNGRENNVRNMAKLYGVWATEQDVEGNPTIEFVSNLMTGNVDLAILNWQSGSIRSDIIGRAMTEGPSSLLIYK